MLRTCLRAVVVAGALAVASPARADDPPGLDTELEVPHERLTLRPKGVRGGRITSLTAWGMLAGGAVSLSFGLTLGIHDYRGPWYDKWKYDRVFRQRALTTDEFLWTAGSLAFAHIPTLMTGVMVEGVGLAKVTSLNTVPGWVGVGMLSGGSAVAALFFLHPVIGIVGGVVGGVGYVLAIAQFGLNVVASKRLSEADRRFLYRRPAKVQVSVVPRVEPGGGGLAVAGRF